MAGPVPTYLATQLAAQTAFNVPFGLLALVNTAITTATAAGEFNVTVDCSLFTAEDVSNLRIYLDSLGYGVEFAKGANEKGLNIDWGKFLDIPGTAVTVFQGTSPWIVAGTVAATQSGPWTVSLTSGSIEIGTVDQGTAGTDPWLVDVTNTVNVAVTNFPAVQPVSGTVTSLQGTSPWVVSGSITTSPDVNVHDGAGNPISSTGTSLDVNVTDFPATVAVTQSTSPWVVSGSVSVSNFPAVQPVSGTVTALQGTSPWVISGSIVTSPNVNIHDSAGNTLSSTGTSLDVNVTNFPATVAVTQSTSPWVIAGSVSVSNFPAVQPVSGTVTALQGTSPWVVSGTVVTSPDVNIHTSTGGTLTATGTALDVNVTNFPATVAVTQSTSPWVVSGTVTANQGTSPWTIAGTVTANIGTTGGLLLDSTFTSRINTLGQKTMANSTPVVIASNQSSIPVLDAPATGSSVTRVASSTASHTLVAANASRRGLILYNDSTGVQYVKFGATASAIDFTHRMTSQSSWEVLEPMYTGVIDALSGNNNGAVQVTELT